MRQSGTYTIRRFFGNLHRGVNSAASARSVQLLKVLALKCRLQSVVNQSDCYAFSHTETSETDSSNNSVQSATSESKTDSDELDNIQNNTQGHGHELPLHGMVRRQSHGLGIARLSVHPQTAQLPAAEVDISIEDKEFKSAPAFCPDCTLSLTYHLKQMFQLWGSLSCSLMTNFSLI